MINLLKLVLKIKGYPLKKAEKELQFIQSLKKDDFIEWKENRKWDIVKHHFENNTTFRLKLSNKIPNTWEEIPVMKKLDFQKPIKNLISKPYNKQHVYIGNTSGSSGHPFYFAKDKFAHAMTYAIIKDRYKKHNLHLGLKQARFYGIPISGKSRMFEQVKDLIFNRNRFSVFDLSDAKLQGNLIKFRKTNFDYIYGYSSAIVTFSKFLLKNQIILKEICPSLRACIVTSEMCSIEDKQNIETALGVKVINEYGASELGIIAIDNSSGEWIISEEEFFVEVLNDNNQPVRPLEPGKIVITSLHNRAMPIIRYEIGDIGRLSDSNSCQLVELLGRDNDFAVLPSGKKASGMTFYYLSRSILESSGILKEFIIKQTAIDTFVIEAVTIRPPLQSDILEIHTMMNKYLEPGLKLKFRRVNEIKRTKSGKIKHFISHLNQHD